MARIICSTGEIAKDYKAYLRTNHWRLKRAEAFDIHGDYCADCKSTDNLHIHHKTYRRVGKEEVTDLIPLCEACHQAEHKRINRHKAQRKKRVRGRGKAAYTQKFHAENNDEIVAIIKKGGDITANLSERWSKTRAKKVRSSSLYRDLIRYVEKKQQKETPSADSNTI